MSIGVKYYGTKRPDKPGGRKSKGLTMPTPVERRPFDKHSPVSWKTGKHLGLRPWPPDGTSDGQVLKWDAQKREWVAGTASASVTPVQITVVTGWGYDPVYQRFFTTKQTVNVLGLVGSSVTEYDTDVVQHTVASYPP